MKKLSKPVAKLLAVPVLVGILAGCPATEVRKGLSAPEVRKGLFNSHGTLEGRAGRTIAMKIEKLPSYGGVQIGYIVNIGKYFKRAYDKDREVCYRKVGQKKWVKEKGYWKKITNEPLPLYDEPFPLEWIVESSKKVSEKKIPIRAQGLCMLLIDYDPGEASALAFFAVTDRHKRPSRRRGGIKQPKIVEYLVYSKRKQVYGIKQPNKQELGDLDKQSDEWIERAKEYYK